MTRWYAPHLGQIHVFPAGSGKEQTSMSRRPEVRELLKQLAGETWTKEVGRCLGWMLSVANSLSYISTHQLGVDSSSFDSYVSIMAIMAITHPASEIGD